MAVRGVINYTIDPSFFKRDARAAVKKALQEQGAKWHQDTLPDHFTESGRNKWKYRGRTRKYRRAKQRKNNNQNPLVWSGDLRRMATRAGSVRSTGKTAIVRMNAPWYATRRFGGKPTYADEMTAVTLNETRVMAAAVQKAVVEGLSNAKRKKTKRF